MKHSDARANAKAERKAKISKRITEIDVLRGVAVILMVFDHLMFDLWGLFPDMIVDFYRYDTSIWYSLSELALDYWLWNVRVGVRYVVLFVFLSLTGVSCSFSKSNLKRGLLLGGVAIGLTIATYLLGKVTGEIDMLITFGILHLISLSIIVIALLEKLTKNKWVYLAIGIAMIAAGAFLLKEDEVSYLSGNFFILFMKQFIGLVVLGPDGYSFLFYGGQIFLGVFLGKLLYPERKSLFFKGGYSDNPLTFVGRHSLIVYVAHQIVIPVIIGIMILLTGYKLSLF